MIVYILLNTVNCKAYIGQTRCNTLSKRWGRNLGHAKPNRHLKSAVAKYGAESFTREILAYCGSQEETDNTERLWIATLRTYDRRYGYNLQHGGKVATHHVPSTVRQIRRRWTPEEKARLAAKMHSLWESRSAEEKRLIGDKIRRRNTGRKRSRKTRKKISKSMKRYWALRRREKRWQTEVKQGLRAVKTGGPYAGKQSCTC